MGIPDLLRELMRLVRDDLRRAEDIFPVLSGRYRDELIPRLTLSARVCSAAPLRGAGRVDPAVGRPGPHTRTDMFGSGKALGQRKSSRRDIG